jgi:oligopeptide/dipeptide ABC transporter ATP-binding protein
MVRHICDRVAVMYLGRVVEMAPVEEMYTRPLHPYTQALLSAIPVPDPAVEARRRRIILTGDVPNPADPPPGCTFHTRCPVAIDRCRTQPPTLKEVSHGHSVSCLLTDV